MTVPCGRAFALDPSALAVIGRALLARVVDAYRRTGVPLPARQFWCAGAVPPDCEQLVVALTGLSEGLVNSEGQIPSPCDNVATASFTVTVARCVPTADNAGNPPPPDKVAAAADVAAHDAYLLAKTACTYDMYGADVPGAPLGGMGVDWSVTVNEPQGGVQTVEMTLSTVVG